VSQGENSRERGRKRGTLIEPLPVGKEKKGYAREEIRQREKKNGQERELEVSKDLSAKSENCRDLFVKQIIPLI
jgi:hypothetical protein